MKRLLFLALFAFAVAALAADPKPNIVLILADDLGINDLSCYGRKDQQTPQLDKLAGQGMRFTAAYCAAPVCPPSRAALLTGKHPARLHLTDGLPGWPDARSQKLLQPVIEGQLPLEEMTLAEVLREAGYATACIGQWHLGGPGFGPREQGFEHVFAGSPNTRGGRGEDALTAEGNRWMESMKDRPFFLHLAFHSDYASVVERMDEGVGSIMKKIDELGLAERTLFIFASDHGGLHVLKSRGHTPAPSHTPFRAGKGFLHEGGLRGPLLIRWPSRIEAGAIEDAPVIFTDLMPTLLAAAGLEAGKTVGPLDGVNLLPLLTGGSLAARPLFWHYPHYTNQGSRPAGAMREGDWKLVEHYEDESAELYHLAQDPGETTDLASSESARAAEMRQKLSAWRKRVGAQEGRPNPDFDAAAHRALYLDRDPSKLTATDQTAAQIEAEWTPWRAAMDAAVQGLVSRTTAASGDIRLLAKDAQLHGTNVRYEAPTFKNTIGFWTKPEDWVSWDFTVATAGKYEIEIQQGCSGGGGSEVAVEVGGQTLKFEVIGTGHFQQFICRTIGAVELPVGQQTLAVKPRNKKGGAVMDLRRVVLRGPQ